MFSNSDIKCDSGIYYIINKENNHIYIGSSINIKRRYQQHKTDCKRRGIVKGEAKCILHRAYAKYEPSLFEFVVIQYISDYLLYEELLIKLFKPEYNTSVIFNGIGKPNLGKKFSKEWSKKLKKIDKHSKETYETISKLNKENSCLIKAVKNDEEITFKSWKEVFDVLEIKRKRIGTIKQYCGWKFEILKTQRKKVACIQNNNILTFNSANDCDKHFDLWRGCTSNSIRNLKGRYSHLFFYYL